MIMMMIRRRRITVPVPTWWYEYQIFSSDSLSLCFTKNLWNTDHCSI